MSTLFRHVSPTSAPASPMRVKADPAAAIPVPRALLLWLTAGVAGTVLFAVIYTLEGATRPGYSAMQQTISSLSFGPEGWMQQANFILCGVSVILLALVWRQILKGGVGARSYPLIHGIEGLGLIALGIFREDPFHTASMIVTVVAMSASLVIIARRFWGNPHWRGWAAFSVACGLWPNLVMPFFGVSLNPHSALSGYTGLIERVATSPDILWGVVVLIPLWAGRSLMRPHVETEAEHERNVCLQSAG